MAELNRNVPTLGMLDPDFERDFKERLPDMSAPQALQDTQDKVYDRDGHFMYGWDYDNISIPLMPFVKQAIPIMQDFKIRDEDIFICAFPSSGTHWFWEMICMLFNRKAEYLTGTKEQDMMEFLLPEIFEKRPSPRVLNTHLRPKYLPEKMIKEGKIILIVRNPKDVVVSNYRQTYGLKVLGYEGSFPSFYEMFLEGKSNEEKGKLGLPLLFHKRRKINSFNREGGILMNTWDVGVPGLGQITKMMHMPIGKAVRHHGLGKLSESPVTKNYDVVDQDLFRLAHRKENRVETQNLFAAGVTSTPDSEHPQVLPGVRVRISF